MKGANPKDKGQILYEHTRRYLRHTHRNSRMEIVRVCGRENGEVVFRVSVWEDEEFLEKQRGDGFTT